MKKRIISFVLAVVMLFSCLSLNIFATAEATEAEEQTNASGTVVSDTLDAHNDEEILAQIPGSEKASKSYFAFLNGEEYKSIGFSGAGNVLRDNSFRFDVTGDGRYVYGAVIEGKTPTDYDNHITIADHTNSNSPGLVLSNYKTSASKDKDFVLQTDLTITQEFIDRTASMSESASVSLFSIHTNQRDETDATKSTFNILQGSWISLTKLYVKDGKAYVIFMNSGKGGAISYSNRFELEVGKNYTIALHADPQNVDEANGIFGSYDAYVNEECVFENVGLLTQNVHKTLILPEDKAYFSNSTTNTWTNNTYTTLKAGAKAYFFTDAFTEEQLKKDENGVPAILKPYVEKGYITITDGKATNCPTPVALGTCRGVKDFRLSNVRMLQFPRTSTGNTYTGVVSPYESDALYLDNIIVYYTDGIYYGTFQEHELSLGEHKHDFESGTTLCEYSCKWCTGKKTVYETLDKNGDRVCDVCTEGIGINNYKKLSPAEVIELAGSENIIISTDFAEEAAASYYGWVENYAGAKKLRLCSGNVSGAKDTTVTLFEQIVTEKDENGNIYVKYQRPVTQYVTIGSDGKATGFTYGEGDDYYYEKSLTNEYLQIDLHSTDIAKVAADWDNGGKPYVISIDFMNYGNYDTTLFELRSPTLLVKDTETTMKTSNISWHPVNISKDGTVYYRNVETSTWVSSGYKIPIGEFVTVSFYHTPATNSFDIYVDGLCIVNDIKAVKDAQNVDYTGEEAWNNYGLVGNSATNYMPSMIRFTQMTVKVTSDVMALDNMKVYYGDFLECDHKYVMNHEHDVENGKNTVTYTCTQCGKVDTAKLDIFNTADYEGTIPTPAEITAYGKANGSKVIISTDFEDTANEYCGLDNPTANSKTFIKVTDDGSGNRVLKYGANESGNYVSGYVQKSNLGSWPSTMNNFNNYKGKAYTVSLSLKLDEDFNGRYNATSNTYGTPIENFFEIICYLAGTDDMTAVPEGQSARRAISPITLLADGTLCYIGYAKGSSTASTYTYGNIKDGKYHEITIHHTPKTNTYALYVDGVLVQDGIGALSQTNIDAMTWTSSQVTGYEGKTLDVNGATDFIPGVVRLAQYPTGPNDSMYIDNFKAYYTDEVLECLHKDIDLHTGVCADCGKTVAPAQHCEICDGRIVSKTAAVNERSASLGELVDMNVYMTIPEALKTTEGAKIVLSCGNRSAEYALADAVAEESGLYKFSIPLRSTQMAEDVTVTVVGEQSYGYTTTIVDYAEALIETSDNASAVKLAKAMLNYGAAAQKYFAIKNGDDKLDDVLANESLSDEEKAAVAEVVVADLKDYQLIPENTASINVTGAVLILSSKTYLKFYFTADADATVTMDGNAVSKIKDGEEYYVVIAASNPKELDDARNIVITSGDKTETVDVNVSVLSAAEAVLRAANLGDEFNNLAKAIYLYSEAANEYVA